MARKGGGFGFVMLLVVVVAVMWLAARAWNDTGQTAIDVTSDDPIRRGVGDHGQGDAADALGDLPDLNEMRSLTDDHAKAVSEALEATE